MLFNRGVKVIQLYENATLKVQHVEKSLYWLYFKTLYRNLLYIYQHLPVVEDNKANWI